MLLFGNIKGKKVVLMQGRFHYYEGYSAREITLPVMVMKLLGVKTIIISNASGGLNPNFTRGDLMVITDHINFIPDNPLRGHIDHKLGQRFTDMYNCYDNKLVDLAEQSARHLRLPLHRGVYAALPGPNLETKAEYRYLRSIGADAVGMSTAPEVIMARFLKMRVLGLSIITDLGIADALKPIGATQIITTARKDNALLVPGRALVERNSGGTYIRLLSGSTATEKPVTTGLRGDGGMVEILSGVQEGEDVITYIKENN